jgi:hypothetical protein
MMKINNGLALSLVLLFISLMGTSFGIDTKDVAKYESLPPLGKWMLQADLKPSNWLGQAYQHKELREPINIIIIDRKSGDSQEAQAKLVKNCAQAGYPLRWGHSSNYKGYLGNDYFTQIGEEKFKAFSNAPAEINNNHGRIFGPYKRQGKYYFAGAFSREIIDVRKIKEMHQYGSFNQARDDFAWKMDKKSEYKVKAFINLNNAIINNQTLTAGDHDGIAILLEN